MDSDSKNCAERIKWGILKAFQRQPSTNRDYFATLKCEGVASLQTIESTIETAVRELPGVDFVRVQKNIVFVGFATLDAVKVEEPN